MKIESVLKRAACEANVYSYWFEVVTFERGRNFLSIQASALHFSVPQRNTTIDKYNAFEVLIEFPYATLQAFPGNAELQQHRVEMNIYGFVPKALIELLLDYLTSNYTLDKKERTRNDRMVCET